MSQQLIAKLESGKARESRKLHKIAIALGVTAETLLADGTKEPSRKGSVGEWPFEIAYERFAQLPERIRLRLEGAIKNAVRAHEADLAGSQFKNAPKKRH